MGKNEKNMKQDFFRIVEWMENSDGFIRRSR